MSTSKMAAFSGVLVVSQSHSWIDDDRYMSTGDLKNNLTKLQKVLRKIDYTDDVDYERISKGSVECFLPLYHYAFISYSRPFAEQMAGKNIELAGKTDLRFVEGMYKVLREIFHYKPAITKDQFFSNGFHERKVIMCTEILEHVHQFHRSKMPRQAKGAPNSSTLSTASLPSTKLGPRPGSAPPNLPEPARSKLTSGSNNAGTHKPRPGMKKSASTAGLSRPTRPPLVVNALHDPPKNSHILPAELLVTRENMVPGSSGTSAGVTDPHLDTANSVAVVSVNPGAYESKQYETDDPLPDGANDCHMRPIDVVAMTPGPPPRMMSERGLQQEVTSLRNVVRELNARVVELEMEVTQLKSAQKRLEEKQQKQNITEASSSGAAPTTAQQETVLARLLLLENHMAILESRTGPIQPLSNGHLTLPKATVNGSCGSLSASGISHHELNIAINPTPTAVPRVMEDTSSIEQPLIPSPIKLTKKATHVAFNSDSPVVYHVVDQPETSNDNGHASTPIEMNGEGGNLEEQFFSSSTQAQRIKDMLKTTEDLLNIQVDSPVRPPKPNQSV